MNYATIMIYHEVAICIGRAYSVQDGHCRQPLRVLAIGKACSLLDHVKKQIQVLTFNLSTPDAITIIHCPDNRLG